MKVLKTLVLGLGILVGCGCGRKIGAYVVSNIPSTTYGTFMGNKPGADFGNQDMISNMNDMNRNNMNVMNRNNMNAMNRNMNMN